jgi:hypothetical protein
MPGEKNLAGAYLGQAQWSVPFQVVIETPLVLLRLMLR